jgi:hypothetical protein
MTWAAIIFSFFSLTLAVADPRPQQVSLQTPDHVSLGKKPKRVQIDILVAKGFHIQANPASREGLIPTEVQIEPSPLFQFSAFKYPKGNPLRLPQGVGEILTYSGNFPVSFELSRQQAAVQPETPKEKKLVKGQVHYQACDDRVCMRPSSIPFEFWVESPK